MNKRKILTALLVSATMAGSVLGLTACNEDHTHSFSDSWSKDGAQHWHACTGCDDKQDVADHKWNGGEVTTQPTETNKGVITYKCEICDATKEEEAGIPQQSFSFAVFYPDGKTPVNGATVKIGGHEATTDSAGMAKITAYPKEYTIEVTCADEQYAYINPAKVSADNTSAVIVLTDVSRKIEYSLKLSADGEDVDLSGVTVKLASGEMIADGGVTDEKGEVKLSAMFKSYAVQLYGLPAGYTYSSVSTTGTKSDVTVFLENETANRVSGGRDVNSPVEIGTGKFTTQIRSKEDTEIAGKYYIAEQCYAVACNYVDGAKYTVTVLDQDAFIVPEKSGLDAISGMGASFTAMLEQGEKLAFSVATVDFEAGADYAKPVLFKVTVELPADRGSIERPIKTQDGNNGMVVESAEDKVYMALDYETFGEYATVEFDENVQVYDLGVSVNGTPTALASGDHIKISEYANQYIYATSSDQNGVCFVNITPYLMPGTAKNPIALEKDKDFNVVFDMSNGITSMWYKAEFDHDADCIIKPTDGNIHSVFDLYADVADSDPVKSASGGSALVIEIKANTPVYIKVSSSMNMGHAFHFKELTEDDYGTSADLPKVIENGTYNAVKGDAYYKFTPAENSKLSVEYSGGGYLYRNLYSDNDYGASQIVFAYDSGKALEYYLEKDVTYYLKVNGESATGTEFTFNLEALASHTHEFTIKSGVTLFEGVTVNLYVGNDIVKTGVTDADGKVTFDTVPANYTVQLENVPQGYAYYENYPYIVLMNKDTIHKDYTAFTNFATGTTALNIELLPYVDFEVTVKLSETEKASGVNVSLEYTNMDTLTGTTDENGYVKINGAPPIREYKASQYGRVTSITHPDASYNVKLDLGDLADDYAYTTAVTVTKAKPEVEITLVKKVTYSVTVNAGAGAQGVKVTLSSGSGASAVSYEAVTGADGTAQVKCVPGAYSIKLDNIPDGYELVTSKSTNATEFAYTIDLVAQAEYKITPTISGTAVEAGLTVKFYKGATEMATGVTDAQGVATMSKVLPDKYLVEVVYPDGKNAYGVTSATDFTAQVAVSKNHATPDTTNNGTKKATPWIVQEGVTLVKSTATTNYIKFTAETASKYKVSIVTGNSAGSIYSAYINDVSTNVKTEEYNPEFAIYNSTSLQGFEIELDANGNFVLGIKEPRGSQYLISIEKVA